MNIEVAHTSETQTAEQQKPARRHLTRREEYDITGLLEAKILFDEEGRATAYKPGYSDLQIAIESKIPDIRESHVYRLRLDVFGHFPAPPKSDTVEGRLAALEARVAVLERRE